MNEHVIQPADAVAWSASPDQQVEAWPPAIELSKPVLEQIRQSCSASIPTRGLLYGTRGEQAWRVTAWLPIQCLNPWSADPNGGGVDRMSLDAEVSQEPPGDTCLVGWFCSTGTAGLELTFEEIRTHTVFFSDEDRLLLKIQPSGADDIAIALYLPEPETGRLRRHSPDLSVSPLPSPGLEGEAARTGADWNQLGQAVAGLPGMPAARSLLRGFGFAGLLVVVVALVAHGWQVWQSGRIPAADQLATLHPRPARLLSLSAAHAASRLEVKWDPRAYGSGGVLAGTVTFHDRSLERSVELDPVALKDGFFATPLGEIPLSVSLTIRTAGGETIRETLRFSDIAMGRPPSSARPEPVAEPPAVESTKVKPSTEAKQRPGAAAAPKIPPPEAAKIEPRPAPADEPGEKLPGVRVVDAKPAPDAAPAPATPVAPPVTRSLPLAPGVSIPQWPNRRRVPPPVEVAFQNRAVYCTVMPGPANLPDWMMWFGEVQPSPSGSRVVMRPPIAEKTPLPASVVQATAQQTLWVSAHLGRNGKLTAVKVLQGLGELEAQTLASDAEKWTFAPAIRNGEVVEVDLLLEGKLAPRLR